VGVNKRKKRMGPSFLGKNVHMGHGLLSPDILLGETWMPFQCIDDNVVAIQTSPYIDNLGR